MTPCAPARARKSAVDSCALDSTKRCPGEHGAKKYLETAITANVVERAPDNRALPKTAERLIAPARLLKYGRPASAARSCRR